MSVWVCWKHKNAGTVGRRVFPMQRQAGFICETKIRSFRIKPRRFQTYSSSGFKKTGPFEVTRFQCFGTKQPKEASNAERCAEVERHIGHLKKMAIDFSAEPQGDFLIFVKVLIA